MKSDKKPIRIHQSKSGITLLDGFFLIKNPRTEKINVISIANGLVYIHDITRQMAVELLAHMDATGQVEVFNELKMTKTEKQKHKNTKNDD